MERKKDVRIVYIDRYTWEKNMSYPYLYKMMNDK